MVENASTSLVATGACAVKDLLEITAQSETTAIQILASMEELVKSWTILQEISHACALKTSLE
jgi:hypothetical protein